MGVSLKLKALLLLIICGKFTNLPAETSSLNPTSSCEFTVGTPKSDKKFNLQGRFLPFQPYAQSLAEHSPITLRQVANLLTEVDSALEAHGDLSINNPAVLKLTVSQYKNRLAALAYKISTTLQMQIDLTIVSQNRAVPPEKKMINGLLIGSLVELFHGPLVGRDLKWINFKNHILQRLGNSISSFERSGILETLNDDELKVLTASAYRFKSALFELFIGLSVPIEGKKIALNMTPEKLRSYGLLKKHLGYDFEIDALVYNNLETTFIETKSYSSALEVRSNKFRNLIIQISTYQKVASYFPSPKIKVVLLNGLTQESYDEIIRIFPDIQIWGPIITTPYIRQAIGS